MLDLVTIVISELHTHLPWQMQATDDLNEVIRAHFLTGLQRGCQLNPNTILVEFAHDR